MVLIASRHNSDSIVDNRAWDDGRSYWSTSTQPVLRTPVEDTTELKIGERERKQDVEASDHVFCGTSQ